MRKQNPIVSVILPTYNEAKNIIPLIKRIFSAMPLPTEVIVVDDDSPDKTWKIAKKTKNKNVRVIRRINQRNLSTAISNGIDKASGKYVVWMDADLSMPPKYIPKLIKALKDYDIAVGSRYVKGGKDKRSLCRVTTSRIINLLTNIILNFKILDYDSGFIAARKDIFNKIKLARAGYGEYCIEFLYEAGIRNFRVKEVSYEFVPRRQGESKTLEVIYSLPYFGWLYIKRIFELRFKTKIFKKRQKRIVY
jgi:dolichol-phosphate mannosyltransferase